jgi:hypothetical protein
MNKSSQPYTRHIEVSFRIIAEDLNPTEISERLRLQPDESNVKGEVPAGRRPLSPFRTGSWQLHSHLDPAEKFEAHLMHILDRLEPCKEDLRKIAQSAHLDFYCKIENESAFLLSAEVLGKIGDIKAELYAAFFDDPTDTK